MYLARKHSRLTKKHGQSLSSVLPVVGCHVKSNCQSKGNESHDQTSASEKVGEKMDVGAGRCRQNAHGQTSVDILQVGPDWSLPTRKG